MAVDHDDDLELTPAQDGEELEEGTEMLPFGDYDRRRASVAAASLTNRARMATLVARQSGSAGCRPPETILRSATGLGWPSGSEQLSPPPGGDGASWLSWFEAMLQWRADCRASIRYNGSLFEYAGLRWVQTSFMQPQAHVFDRFLYNDTTHTYTIDRFLADLQSRYGGIDSVLLWPTYPNIGMDDRNQFDMIGSLPGGLAKLRLG